MQPAPDVEYADVARADTDRGELVLRRRTSAGSPAVLELRVNGVYVMDTQETSTEVALARAALERAESPRRVLVGGLGLGFTLRTVLDDARVERVVVVEIEEPLVGWLRDGTVPHGPALLADERLTVAVLDVALAVREAGPAAYDLVLLDVDNGPDQLVHEPNAQVYAEPFLAECRRALAPGGVLAVWSATASPELGERLRTVFGDAVARAYDVDLQGRRETYWLHLGLVPPRGVVPV